MSPDERVRFLGHVRLTKTAWSFLEPAVRDGDLRAGWPVVAPDRELLYVHDTTDLVGGAWQPGEVREVYPLLMRWDGDGVRWFVLNLGTDVDPQPGWPPSWE